MPRAIVKTTNIRVKEVALERRGKELVSLIKEVTAKQMMRLEHTTRFLLDSPSRGTILCDDILVVNFRVSKAVEHYGKKFSRTTYTIR
jgi:hypothetical protein